MFSHAPCGTRVGNAVRSPLLGKKSLRWCTAVVTPIQGLTAAKGLWQEVLWGWGERSIHGVEGTKLNHFRKIQLFLASQNRFLDLAVTRSGYKVILRLLNDTRTQQNAANRSPACEISQLPIRTTLSSFPKAVSVPSSQQLLWLPFHTVSGI